MWPNLWPKTPVSATLSHGNIGVFGECSYSDADLSGAHPPAAAAQQGARPARGDRLARADGRAHRLGPGAPRLLRAAGLSLAVWQLAGAVGDSGWHGDVDG